jgi:alkylresorcinol/alkylpyrone synthase
LPEAVAQDDVARFAVELYPELGGSRHLAIFANAGIEHRHLARPLDWYRTSHPLSVRAGQAADLGLHHAARAASDALDVARVTPDEVDAVVLVTSTVLQVPTIDAALVSALGLRDDVRRVPVLGMASLGGASALGLARELVAAGHGTVLVVAVEMNSLTFVGDDRSMDMLVSMALFSDGAAAVVVRGGGAAGGDPAGRDGPVSGDVALVGRHSTLVPDTAWAMGFDVADTGLRWHLAPNVPEVASRWARVSIEAAFSTVAWSRTDDDHALIHPGGAKVLDAVEDALGLPRHSLHWSRETMRDHGNVSSVTVLLMLERFLAARPAPGPGLITAMGPGFAFEHVLFEHRPSPCPHPSPEVGRRERCRWGPGLAGVEARPVP